MKHQPSWNDAIRRASTLQVLGAAPSGRSTAAVAPLVVVGILLERYIVKGSTAGAVK